MEQFSLEKYLENPTRKVVTRNGKTVRIVCWDKLGEYPIIGCVKYSDDYEDLESYDINGFKYSFDREDQNDLFFADEEKELTEFEKAVKQVMWTAYNYDDCSNGKDVDDISNVKATSKTLLDLARKELLKDLPKWKKSGDNLPYSHIGGLNERYLIKNCYCIKISDLETLPKEE